GNNDGRSDATGKPASGATALPGGATTAPSQDDGYVFKKGDVTVAMKAKAADIIADLGEPSNYYESPSCAFEGMDKTYSYPGFDVTTYTESGVDYISGVVFWDDSVETPEGLYIGASAADVQRIYGADAAGKTNVQLEKGSSYLLILFKDDSVTSIQYLAKN
ncbi:MAG: hypothetical protein J6Y21_03080, partial [Clostridia bacterium]|nr:hypothetical protein [Clostridia bacterium]